MVKNNDKDLLNFQINRNYLKNKSSLINILNYKKNYHHSNIHFYSKNKNLIVEFINSENFQIKINLFSEKQVSIETEGEFFLNVNSFLKINNIFDNEEINNVFFEVDAEDKILLIESSKTKVNFSMEKKDEKYPLNFNLENEIVAFSINFKDFKKSIEKTFFAVDKKKERPILSGILYDFSKNNTKILLTATDSYRLSRTSVDILDKKNIKGKKIKKFIIPFEVIQVIEKIFNFQEKINFRFDEKYLLVFDNEEKIHFKTSFIEGEFPNIENVFPKEEEFKTKIWVNKREFANSIKRARSFFGKEISNNSIKVSFQKEKLILYCKNDAQENIEIDFKYIKFEGVEQNIFVNILYLRDSVNAFDSEEICIKVVNKEKPVIICSDEEKETCGLFLPLNM